jgi:fibronectin-binding autotransporter adhesin
VRSERSSAQRLTRPGWRLLLTGAAIALLGWVVVIPAASAATASPHEGRAQAPGSCTDVKGTVDVSASETLTCVTVESGATLQLYDNGGCGSSFPTITLTLTDGGTIKAGGTLALYSSNSCDEGGDSVVDVSGGTLVNDGTLITSWAGPGSAAANGGNRYLQGNITNNATITVSDTTYLDGPGTFSNSGVLDLVTNTSNQCEAGYLEVPGSGVTFDNNAAGTIESGGVFGGCGGSPQGMLQMASGNTFTENGPITIPAGDGNAVLLQGDALHYTGGGAGTIEVQGGTTLSGNIAKGQTLQLDGATGFCQIASAAVTAAAGFTNAGTITGDCGGTVSLTVISGTLTNTGTIATSPASLDLSGNVVNTGSVQTGSGQSLTYQGRTFTNKGTVVVSNSSGTFTIPGGTGATFANEAAGTISNTGSFSLGSGNTFKESGAITGNNVLLIGDALDYTGGGRSTIEVQGGTTLSGNIAKDQTLQLDGATGFCQITSAAVTAAAGFTNAGTITGGCGGSPSLTVTSGTLTNTGTIEAAGGADLTVQAAVDNEGILSDSYHETLSVSALTNYDSSTSTLTGGKYVVYDGGNGISVPGLDIHTLDATVVIYSGSLNDGATDALRNLSVNEGSLTLTSGSQGGVSETLSGSLTNSGKLAVGPDDLLTVNGSFTQTPAGQLTTVVGGTSAGSDYGQLRVNGPASLAGTLVISKVKSYTAAKGDTQQVLTYSAKSGQFASVQGTAAGQGLSFVLQYTPSAAELVVTRSTLTVSPTSGPADSIVKLTGKGFSPGETVSVSFTDAAGTVTSLPAAVAGSGGGFAVSATVPAAAVGGAGTFTATGQASGVTKTATFTVT